MAILFGGSLSAAEVNDSKVGRDSRSLLPHQDGEDSRITPEAMSAMEELRQAYRSPPGISIKVTGHSSDGHGNFRPIRTSLLIAASGDIKLLSPAYNLTHQRGTVYADSTYFPGYLVKTRVPRAPDATVAALQSIWPLAPLPLELRIRLASSARSAFAPMLDAIGEDGAVDVMAGVWPDGTPAQGLRFQGGGTDLVVWIDPGTSLVRGVRGRIAHGEQVTDLDEAREVAALDRQPAIVVATKDRIPVASFDALRAAWERIHTSPPPPGFGGE